MGKRAKALLCALALVAVLGTAALPRVRRAMRENGCQAVRRAIERSAVTCYSVEGAYPESLAYLQEHYGLTVNTEDYIIIYDVYASNQPPEVQVLVRGENGA